MTRIGPQMPQFQKEADNRVWKGTEETFDAIENEDEKKTYTCTICLLPKLVKEDLWILPCGHFFHKDCILNWARTKNTCPECRESFADADDRTMLLREDKKRDSEGGGRGFGAPDPLPSPRGFGAPELPFDRYVTNNRRQRRRQQRRPIEPPQI